MGDEGSMGEVGPGLRGQGAAPVAVTWTVAGVMGLWVLPRPGGVGGEVVARLGIASWALLGLLVLHGLGVLGRPVGGMGKALREGAWALALAGAAFVLAMAGLPSPAGDATGLLLLSLLCLSVGICEELLFRGVLLGALLADLGVRPGGVTLACVGSGLIFGLAHVAADCGGNVQGVLQMILKVLQSGALGMLLAAVVVRTRSVWGAVAIHSLSDLLLASPAALSGGEALPSSYVTGDMTATVVLAAAVLCSVPMVVHAVRLTRLASPDPGWMGDDFPDIQ